MNLPPVLSRSRCFCLPGLFFLGMCFQFSSALAEPLFEREETLKLTITAPFHQISDERDKGAIYPASLVLSNTQKLPISLQVRGNNRLKKTTCDHPPLRILLEKKSTKDTLFDKQSKLKLVVQCNGNKLYREYIRLEYLIYKMYALLADNYFKVRWLEVTYQETDPDYQRRQIENAFFIEQKKRLRKRLTLDSVKSNSVAYEKLNDEVATLVDLFQFMIGNADYSNIKSPGDEDCCHNIKLMIDKKIPGFIPIPYDFDNAGLINARYATSPPFMQGRPVTSRVYRGLCATNSVLPHTLAIFLKEKESLLDIIRNDEILQKKSKAKAVKYLNKFFSTIESEKKQNRQLYQKCRG